ncbi:MAG: MMPL family transporter [Bacteriovoracaceae bacterium]|jgi:uncharacterized protein|nr:MMPL family transporter [Bacteriovoracaceae bacterium]
MKLSDNFKQYFSNFLIQQRWFCLALVIFILSIGLFGLTKIQSDFTYRVWFNHDNPMLQQYDYFEKTFGNDDSVIFAVRFNDGDAFTISNLKLLKKLTEKMWDVPNVIRVDSLDNYLEIKGIDDDIEIEPFIPEEIEGMTNEELKSLRTKVLAMERAQDFLISKDLKTVAIYGSIRPFIDEKPLYDETVQVAQKLVNDFRAHHNIEIHLTGTAPVTTSFSDQTLEDLKLVTPIILTIIFISIYFIFKSFLPIPLVITMIALTIISSLGIGALSGVKLNVVTSMLPNILMAISIADSIHLLKSFQKYLQEFDDKMLAIHKAIHKVLLPTILTSISTGLGFLSLSFSDIKPISSLGSLAFLGAFTALFFTYFWLVPLLTILPFKAKKSQKDVKRSELKIQCTKVLVGYLQDFKYPISIFFIILTSSAIYLSRNNVVNSNIINYFKPSLPIVIAQRFIEKHIGGIGVIEVVVDSEKEHGILDPEFLKKAEQYQEWILTQHKVTKVNSIITIVKEINGVLTGNNTIPNNRKSIAENIFLYSLSLPQGMGLTFWTSIDQRYIRLKIQIIGLGSHAGLQRIEAIRKAANRHGLVAKITGKSSMVATLDKMIVKTFISSMTLAVFLVCLFMIIVFRSLKLGLLSMIPNVVPPILGLGVMNLLHLPIDVSTILISSVCLGIAVDDTIYFISDYHKSYSKNQNTFEAILKVYSHTGSALFWTTFVLVSAFLCFMMGSFTPNSNFGFLTSVVLILALISDLIFLPALLFITDTKRKYY